MLPQRESLLRYFTEQCIYYQIGHTHEGEEFIYVLEGVLEINYGKNTYILEEGDSIYYDSIVAHHVHAAADNTAKILGVIYTPY